MVARTASLLFVAHRAGTDFVIENPADRGDVGDHRLFMHGDHGPLWLMPEILALKHKASTKQVTFAQCAFNAPWQKYTTFMYTAGLDEWLSLIHI